MLRTTKYDTKRALRRRFFYARKARNTTKASLVHTVMYSSDNKLRISEEGKAFRKSTPFLAESITENYNFATFFALLIHS